MPVNKKTFFSWLTSSLVRNFPSTAVSDKSQLKMEIASNEHFSFQLALRNCVKVNFKAKNDEPQKVAISVVGPENWEIRIRRVGYVPVAHLNTRTPFTDVDNPDKIPGFVPDPLFDESEFKLPANETHSFWFSINPKGKNKPGHKSIKIIATFADKITHTRTVKVKVYPISIAPRKNFFVTNWFYNDAIFDFHDCQPFDEKYWQILPAYLKNMVEHGQDTLLVPVFTPPLDGVKRPSQLLKVSENGPGKYKFDWSDVKRYVNSAKKSGFTRFEWSHLFTQWGARDAIRIYKGQGLDEKLLWPAETSATSPVYRRFLEHFHHEFHTFLVKEKLLTKSSFHLSDEPHGDEHLANYRKAREMLRTIAPWMKVMDALSEIEFAREKLTDHPIPVLTTAIDFVREGIPCSCYYCCWPRGEYLNRLLDTPLAKIRMNGWLFYRWPLQGFLHWGYNYWYKSQTRNKIDPFTVSDGAKWPGWAHGDPFVVYPGKDGPLDSIRWEVFSESLQDYALLQTAGIKPESLKELKSFKDFPKNGKWLAKKRREIFSVKHKTSFART